LNDIKRPAPQGGAESLGAHSARDFNRGFMTKNIIKGAGGGARGVDFQDAEADFLSRGEKPAAGGPVVAEAQASPQGNDAEARALAAQNAERLAQELAAEFAQLQRDKVETPQEYKDEEKKKKKLALREENHNSENEAAAIPDEEVLAEPVDDDHRAHLLANIARLLQDPTAERRVLGALALTDPEQMRKTLGSPVRVAKHLLVLAGRMLKEKEKERGYVVEYLANTFLALGPEFGKRAFKDFSGAIGIGSIYPLEVHERLLLTDDKFLPTLKCRFTSGRRVLKGMVREMILLEYPADMRITEFGVKGGCKTGYQLTPLKERGKYGLKLFEPGEFRLLMLGVDTMGFERLEELRIQVEPNPVAAVPKPGAPKKSGVLGLTRPPS